jgi:hypothetical protein
MAAFPFVFLNNIFPLVAKSKDTYKETGDPARLPQACWAMGTEESK